MPFFEYMLAPVIIGVGHSIETDHVVAVGNLVITRERWIVQCLRGVAWGVGHTVSVMVSALVIGVVKDLVKMPENFSFEIFVGLMMLIIGVVKMIKAVQAKDHHHSNNSVFLFFNVGLVHGLAGSGAIAALLSTQTSNIAEQIHFLLSFGLGTVIGMGAVASVVSKVSFLKQQYVTAFSICIACLSFAYGSKIIYEHIF